MMRAYIQHAAALLVAALCLLNAPQVRAELIAANSETRIAYLTPLRNGLSALTLVWPMEDVTEKRADALAAGLLSVTSGGTASRSPFEIHEYRKLNGIRQSIATTRTHLLFTISAPNEVFLETLVHLENLLMQPTYSKGWFDRNLQLMHTTPSTLTRNPGDVLHEINSFLDYNSEEASPAQFGPEFRFGQPSQAVLRSDDDVVKRRVSKLLAKLPRHAVNLRVTLPKWLEVMLGRDRFTYDLPSGTIHFQDPTSSEMLILLINAATFDNEEHIVGANLLANHIGANQSAEMFLKLRQEMRASYDPTSQFVMTDKNTAMIMLSATVAADRWPQIYASINDIYSSVRSGDVSIPRLDKQHQTLSRSFSDDAYHNPVWTARQYLYEYPDGASGQISLPIFTALEAASTKNIIANASSYLPPLDDYLLILIGGGPTPSADLKANGYCPLPPNTPLKHCLQQLRTEGN
ncbi:hypothetical protein [uncultured Shimia sp.]|uniref:hypothetical protein n=1 Tax=uncultured Shimia sp. TaxID=573152 RepID=UPI0026033659|nr:hypothetical protein [uncultured Shimia sp.]